MGTEKNYSFYRPPTLEDIVSFCNVMDFPEATTSLPMGHTTILKKL